MELPELNLYQVGTSCLQYVVHYSQAPAQRNDLSVLASFYPTEFILGSGYFK